MTLDYLYCKKHFKSWHTEEDKKIADEYLKHNKGWTSDFNTDQCSQCNEPGYVILKWKDIEHRWMSRNKDKKTLDAIYFGDDYQIVDAIKFKKDEWGNQKKVEN